MDNLIDETKLVAALKNNEPWAFETVVRLHGARLLAVARRIVRNDDDANDVLQSAYLNAFRALKTFEASSQLSTWLHRIVVNVALMKIRTRRRKPEGSIEDLLPAFHEDGHHVEQFSDWSMPADVLIEREENRRAVRQCIDQLPDGYRAVLMLRDIEDRTTQEVAELLELTPTAVKVRLHRARQALTTLLRREFSPAAAGV